MAVDNVVSNPGASGAVFRTLADASSVEWPTGVVCYATTVSAGSNVLQVVTPSFGLPVAQQGTWNITVNAALPTGANVIGGVTQSGTWTVTANQGGTWTVATNADGSVTGGSAGSKSLLTGGVYNTSLPALTNGQQAGIQLDSSGRLLVGSIAGSVTVSGTVTANQGSTWTVQPGNTANTTPWLTTINQGGNSATVTAGNALKVDGSGATQPVSGTITANAGTGNFGANITQIAGSTVATSSTGSLKVGITDSAGTSILVGQQTMANSVPVVIASNNTPTVQPGNTANTTPWLVTDTPATSGGYSINSFLSTAAVQSTAIKASAGQVYGLQFFNTAATPCYVRLYNQTTAPATTDTANILWRGTIPGNANGAGYTVNFDKGLTFSTGIGMRVTASVADNDGTVLAANAVIGNVEYK